MTAVRIPWPRLLAESVVVVLSILLALAVDTWWSERQDRFLERAELEGIRAQLMETHELLQGVILSDEASLASTERLIEAAAAAGDGSITVTDSLLRRQGITTRFEPSLSRFESVVASGRLALVQNDELRASIAAWPRIAQTPTVHATGRRDLWADHQMPHVTVTQPDVSPWLANYTPHGTMVVVRVDPVLTNLLRRRLFFDGLILRSENNVMIQLEELVGALDAEIAKLTQ